MVAVNASCSRLLHAAMSQQGRTCPAEEALQAVRAAGLCCSSILAGLVLAPGAGGAFACHTDGQCEQIAALVAAEGCYELL